MLSQGVWYMSVEFNTLMQSFDTAIKNKEQGKFSKEDVSFGAGGRIVRVCYNIGISRPATHAKLQAICEDVISGAKQERELNAIAFRFYYSAVKPKPFSSPSATANWAPDGEWAKAKDVRDGDYSRHTLSIRIY